MGHQDGATGHTLSPLRRLIWLLASERRDIGIVVFFAVGVGLLSLATPIAIQALVNIVSFGGLIQPLIILGLMLLAFLSMAAALRAFKAYIVEILQRRLFVRVLTHLSHRLPRVRVKAFDRNHGPELVNRFFDVLTVQKVGATLLLDTVAVVLQATIGLLILAFYHPLLLAFDVMLLVGFLIILFGFGRGALRTAISESMAKYAVAGSLEEIARHPSTFKQAGGPAYARLRADQLAVDYVNARRQHFRVVFRQVISSLALQAIAATVMLTVGGWLVIKGQLTLGQLVAAELIVSIVLASFAKLGQKLENFYDLLTAVDKLGQLIDLPLERTTGENRQLPLGGAALVFRNVHFAYDQRRPALSEFNLSIQPGERVLIVGRNGSGKSTLAAILSGLREVNRGSVELDGVDIRELNLETLRNEVAVVTGFEIIEATIEENVRMNRSDVTSDEVRAILQALGLLDEVRLLPDGLATRLNSNAGALSYGQARRLMLARAMAGRPRLLVLDDVLEDLDPESARRTAEVLVSPTHPWTLIVLGHSEDLIDGMHRVLRLRDGKLQTVHLANPSGEAA